MADDSISTLNESEDDKVAMNHSQGGYVKTAAYNYSKFIINLSMIPNRHARLLPNNFWFSTIVSRKSLIHGARNVEMKGKSIIHAGAHIRGDFQTVRIGRYCRIGEKTIIRPPSYQASLDSNEDQIRFLPLVIGSHTRIGKDCVVEAASIGSSVYIGDGCVISKRVIIKDCCFIEAGTVIAADMVIPPFSRVKGRPAKMVDEGLMPESFAVTFVEDCVEEFTEFLKHLEDGDI